MNNSYTAYHTVGSCTNVDRGRNRERPLTGERRSRYLQMPFRSGKIGHEAFSLARPQHSFAFGAGALPVVAGVLALNLAGRQATLTYLVRLQSLNVALPLERLQEVLVILPLKSPGSRQTGRIYLLAEFFHRRDYITVRFDVVVQCLKRENRFLFSTRTEQETVRTISTELAGHHQLEMLVVIKVTFCMLKAVSQGDRGCSRSDKAFQYRHYPGRYIRWKIGGCVNPTLSRGLLYGPAGAAN